MGKEISCFVIIGYGKKTSYANGKVRVLDLDETFTLMIKPVFDALGIPCYRAIDKNLSGSIDKLMLQEIKDAELVVVDISTLNANVLWELGVRHALKPKHTIMICEKEQMSNIPFDINHFVVQQYAHSEEGIPFKEVDRFRNVLTNLVNAILKQDPGITDSPVFTFLEDAMKKDLVQNTEAVSNPGALTGESFATIMSDAETAKNNKDFEKALELLSRAKEFAKSNMTLKDNLTFIICRQALSVYKMKKPNEQEALLKARTILEELNPQQSQDLEVIGLSGAIHKRLNELTNDISYLDTALQFYEKGFQLKQDYYNGINTAFMLYKKTGMLKSQGKEWEDLKLKADYIRNTVLEICNKLESGAGFPETTDAVWVLLSIAEAYNYKNYEAGMKEYEEKARALSEKRNDAFAMNSYEEQKEKIKNIFSQINT